MAETVMIRVLLETYTSASTSLRTCEFVMWFLKLHAVLISSRTVKISKDYLTGLGLFARWINWEKEMLQKAQNAVEDIIYKLCASYGRRSCLFNGDSMFQSIIYLIRLTRMTRNAVRAQ